MELENNIHLTGAIHDIHKTLECTAPNHLIAQRNIPTNNALQLYDGTCYRLILIIFAVWVYTRIHVYRCCHGNNYAN